MDHSYSAAYRDLHENHWWFRARRRYLLDVLEDLAPEDGFGPILDIGAGDGLFLPDLEAFGRPEGLEPVADIVSPATRTAWTMHLVPFDERFDPGTTYGLIGMFDVLEHLDDDLGALRQVRRLLRPGGLAILTVPALRALWTLHDDLNEHRRRYTRRSLRRVVESAGLEILELRYFFHWLVPVKLAIRAKERLLGGVPELPAVPAPCPNRAFLSLAQAERMTWGRIRWPFGSSLLVVARAG